MKSLFRSIRHKLLGEGKPLRYLTYAVGEILLIIIGILFALKINDWNEENKARGVETKILAEIRSNLILDLDEIRADIVLLEVVQKSCTKAIHLIGIEEVPSDAFQSVVGNLRINPHFDPNRSGYDLLKSKGVEIILDDALRRSISDLYESAYTYYFRYEEERNQFAIQTVHPTLMKYFSWSWNCQSVNDLEPLDYGIFFEITEEDYTLLKSDSAFRKLVQRVYYEYFQIQDRAERTEGIIVELIEQLNEELGISEEETE